MNVGVVGVCGFGQHHAAAFEAVGCRVAAVADVAEELDVFAEKFSAVSYRDYRDLLEHPELEALSFSLPPRLHPEAIRAALARGLPVFCEKPVAPSAAEAEALLREVGADAPVAVGFSFRYHPAYRRLRELVHAGELGRVRTISARKCWGTRTPWRLQPGGGAVFVKDIHYYDLVPWLLDVEPDSLCAYGGNFYHSGQAEDSYSLLMRFPGSATFHLDSAWWTLSHGVNTFEVVGDRARVVVERNTLRMFGETVWEETPAGEEAVVAEMRAFVRWLRGEGERPPGLTEALRANRLAQRVVDALKKGGGCG